MDVQNAVNFSSPGKLQTGVPTAPIASAPAPGSAPSFVPAGPTASPAAAGVLPGAAPNSLPPATLAQAADTLQKQVSQQAPSVALTAGLDPNGGHPGQLLVELKDKQTQQVFVRYYVPSQQVVKAAAQSPDQPMSPGSLLQEKA
ncbi:MAG: hypothetical protein B7Z79_07445 [Thiomonas sp. 20-64-9]|uniref:Uncharacterized protein n=1 Tax=Thiomonas arsenitoxydans (strain DSM 22701 / CIP 110005 / 3As) TaxID=426114 RepID=A0A8I1SX00_THIA3|nr:hypothetical protein [Thiomonas arsenitoxydans]ODU96161.1 MAG: hypothetical protein ABT24_09830 [Thiomonas sp. SCN 64-16]OJV46231.1 MAG: hypothetical protein BGO40_09645 [Chryseobacterium sp. 39-10]OYV30281.1 MAG: hypothetical protein B7Z79_07445 [Thiomonas sp. 20-64-9]